MFSFWLMGSPYVNGDEQALIGNLSTLKNIWLNIEIKPDPNDFIFINVAYDQQLNTKKDENGFDQGKESITDRHLLARFFNILNQKPNNQVFILCDIFFNEFAESDACGPSKPSADSLLAVELAKTKNLLLSTHLNANDSSQQIVFHAPTAIADYQVADEMFLKFQLIYQDTVKTIPLRMYEIVHHTTANFNGWFIRLGDAWFLNTIIPDMTIRQFNLFGDPTQVRYKVDNLTNILSGVMTDQQVLEYVKDRIIVIGDFENKDIHKTIYGDTAGSLLLLNTYLTLKKGNNQITLFFIAFLWLSFSGISYLIFIKDNPSDRLRTWLLAKKWFLRIPILLRETSLELLNYPMLLAVVSIISFIFFDVTISILYLVIWLFLIRQGVGVVFGLDRHQPTEQ